MARRFAGFLVAALLFAIPVPLSQGFRHGWELAAGIMFRGSESFLAGLWLMNVIPFDQLLATLRRWGMPAILTAILALMYRFLFVLWSELETMALCAPRRNFNRGGILFRWRTGMHMVGMLLSAAMARSERVHGAMCSRGWDGQFRTLDE